MNNKLIKILTVNLVLALFTVTNASIIVVNSTDGIVVVDGKCSISEAIISANTDTTTNECVAGNGTDIIELSNDISLTQAFENHTQFGQTGTPTISTTIVLDGKGFILQRLASLTCNLNNSREIDEFRLLRTITSANLTLKNITIGNGCADGNLGNDGAGGGLFNNGSLSLDQVTIMNNQAQFFGGGIDNNIGIISAISKSLFVNNQSNGNGGGLYNGFTTTLIENSTFSGNSATNGGGIFNESEITNILNTTFANNFASIGAVIYNGDFGMISNLNNSLFDNNGFGFFECVAGDTFNGNNNLTSSSSTNCPATTSATLNLQALADNSGATQTHAFFVGSDAIDAAVGGTLSDQRGFSAFGVRDIGAYEAQIPLVTAPANILLEAMGLTTPVILGTATVVDYVEAGLTATADMIGPFAVGIHTVTWTAIDALGFTGTATQTVTITDTTAPIITLLGNAIETLNIGDNYSDATATASDLADGDLTAAIIVVNPVDVNTSGNYTITYNVIDNQGNNALQVSRLVKVQASIGGTVTGLTTGNSVILQNNVGNDLEVTADGNFTFTVSLDNFSNYQVTVLTQPITPNQSCSVTNDQGQLNGSNITNILVSCTTNQYFIGGYINGLPDVYELMITNNGKDAQILSSNGAFVFSTPLGDLENYEVQFQLIPSSSESACEISNNSGVIDGIDITNVSINCLFSFDLIYKNRFE